VNLHVYHYAGNNPVKLVDPDGRYDVTEYLKYQVTTGADIDRLKTRFTYSDMGLAAYGPCYMRSLIGVAETFIGRNLTLSELDQLETILTSGDNPTVDKNSTFEVNGKTYPAYYVKDSEVVIKEALKILDPENNYDVRVARSTDTDYDKIKDKAVGSLINVPGHWQEGNKNGRFRWDPFHRLNNAKYWNRRNENDIRYVSIIKDTNKTQDM
jgi:hypothetical protein